MPWLIRRSVAQIDSAISATEQTPAWKSVMQDQVKSFTDLYRLCSQYFKVEKGGKMVAMASTDVVRELGYSSTMDIRETPWECWLKITSVRK